MTQPLFSILIANYNNGKYFKDCFDSIRAQTYNNFEVIIVDDQSTDDSAEVIQDLIKKDSRFKFWTNKDNKGCGFTKRRCVEMATGEIFGFVDPDDTITTDALEMMTIAHKENPEAVLIHSKWKSFDEKWNYLSNYKNGTQVDKRTNFLNLKGEVTQFSTIKKTEYDKTEGIDPDIQRAVDIDLYLKMSEIGSFKYLDKFLYNYRINSNGISTGSNVYKAYYWRWIVNFNAAKRRGVNYEDLFSQEIVKRTDYNIVLQKYYQLKKFEFLQKIIDFIKSKKKDHDK